MSLRAHGGDRPRPPPYRPGKRNYVPLMIVALAASLVLGRHLISLVSNM
jgi:hypothetical protein